MPVGAMALALTLVAFNAPARAAPAPAPSKSAAKPAAKAPVAQPAPRAKPAPKPPAAAPVKIPEAGVLEQHHLMAIAAAEMRSNPDPFKTSSSAKYDGRPFVLEQTLRQADDSEYAETNGRWSYDKQAGKLRFAIENSSEFDIYYKETTLGRFVAQNAFGAKWPAVHRQMAQVMVETAFHSADPFEMPATAEEARALTMAVALRIEGRLNSGPAGVLSCSEETESATISDPVQWDRVRCSLSAAVETITLFDRRSGSALKTWIF